MGYSWWGHKELDVTERLIHKQTYATSLFFLNLFIETYFICYKIHPFQVYSSMNFSNFTDSTIHKISVKIFLCPNKTHHAISCKR